MPIFHNPFRRDKPSSSQEDNASVSSFANSMIYTRKQSSAQEDEARQGKGIDIDMIDPQDVIDQFKNLATYEEKVLEVEADKDGNILYESVPMRNPDGSVALQDEVVKTEVGTFLAHKPIMVQQPRKTVVRRMRVRPWAATALGYLNPVWPTIWMSADEADTTWLGVRVAFHDIRKSMTYEEKKEYTILLRMARDLCLARCEDMKEGHKALLLKVNRQELGVHMSRGNENIRGR